MLLLAHHKYLFFIFLEWPQFSFQSCVLPPTTAFQTLTAFWTKTASQVDRHTQWNWLPHCLSRKELKFTPRMQMCVKGPWNGEKFLRIIITLLALVKDVPVQRSLERIFPLWNVLRAVLDFLFPVIPLITTQSGYVQTNVESQRKTWDIQNLFQR